MTCEQIINDQGFYYPCGEPAVTTFKNTPLCAKCYESVTGKPWVDEEEDITESDIEKMDKERGI